MSSLFTLESRPQYMNEKALTLKLLEALPKLKTENLVENEKIIADIIKKEFQLDSHAYEMRSMKLEHLMDKIKSYETPWWERAYQYPKTDWECPKCLHLIGKRELKWNWMTSENCCPICREPQRQYALPPY